MTTWWPDDDPADIAALPITRPHDEATCRACLAYVTFTSPRQFALAYPQRFRETMDHRRSVRASTGASREVVPDATSELQAGTRSVVMEDGHDGLLCARCLRYAFWVWPFANHRWDRRDAEAEWLKTAGDGYLVGSMEAGNAAARQHHAGSRRP